MELEIIILSSQTEKDKCHMLPLTCGIWNTTRVNLSTKQKQTYTGKRLAFVKGRGRRGDDWEFGVSRWKLFYTGEINSKVLLCDTGNHIQYPVMNFIQLLFFQKPLLRHSAALLLWNTEGPRASQELEQVRNEHTRLFTADCPCVSCLGPVENLHGHQKRGTGGLYYPPADSFFSNLMTL